MRKLVATCLFLSIALHQSHAEGTALDSLKQKYDTEVQRIRNEHETELERLLDAYGSSLDTATATLRRGGDPDPVLKAISEKTRFEKERTVPKKPTSGLSPRIQKVRNSYHDAVKKAAEEQDKNAVETTRKYVAALDRLMRTLTESDRLDLALNAKSEKERAKVMLGDIQKGGGLIHSQLWASLKKAVATKAFESTPTFGRGNGRAFSDIPDEGALLIGFVTTLTSSDPKALRSVQPIYRSGSQGRFLGLRHGGKGEEVLIEARDGYAVGAVTVGSDEGSKLVRGVKVTFMRIGMDGLDPNRSYDSEWVGVRDVRPMRLSSNGRPILGVSGRQGLALDRIALVFLRQRAPIRKGVVNATAR